jgi:hypothetical protein
MDEDSALAWQFLVHATHGRNTIVWGHVAGLIPICFKLKQCTERKAEIPFDDINRPPPYSRGFILSDQHVAADEVCIFYFLRMWRDKIVGVDGK